LFGIAIEQGKGNLGQKWFFLEQGKGNLGQKRLFLEQERIILNKISSFLNRERIRWDKIKCPLNKESLFSKERALKQQKKLNKHNKKVLLWQVKHSQ
jgi:hypothetical protein